MFSSTVYVMVKRNQFRLRNIESNAEVVLDAQPPFSNTRLLIGEYLPAEKLLKRGLKQVLKPGLFAVSPKVLIHPLEMAEGGLSEIEERVLHEVAMGAGARKVVVWVGPRLSDAEVKAKLK